MKHDYKSSIWIKMLGSKYYNILRDMNNSIIYIERWQKQRFYKSCIFLIIGLILYALFKQLIYIPGGMIFSIVFYFLQVKSINRTYNQFKFERHLQFSKFTRLLIPYLKQQKESSLYGIFGKIVGRLDYDTDKKLLMKLMQEMTDKPKNIQPFLDYAEQSSGTDMSILFMSTVFDINQGFSDLSVIEELDRLASEELMSSVDAIISYKTKRFAFYPTKIAMASFILVIGFAAGVLFFNIKNIQFKF